MLTIILTSIATFIATGIDEIVIITVFFVYFNKRSHIRDIYIGQQISMIVLLTISLLAVFGIAFVPKFYIGFLGLIPIYQGLKILITGKIDSDDEYDKKELVQKHRKKKNLILSVASIAIAGGAEELSIYIPYFASLDAKGLIIVLIAFNLLVPVWCRVCQKLSRVKKIEYEVEKYSRIVIPVVFVGLGIFVLIQNNTLSFVLQFLSKLF